MSLSNDGLEGPRVAGLGVDASPGNIEETVKSSLEPLPHQNGSEKESSNAARLGELTRILTSKLDNLCDAHIITLKAEIKVALEEALSVGVDCSTLILGKDCSGRRHLEVSTDRPAASPKPTSPPSPTSPKPPAVDKDEIAMIFSLIDKDGSGEVEKSEFVRALKVNEDVATFCREHERLRPLLDPLTFGERFASVDEDASNSISEKELRTFLINASLVKPMEKTTPTDSTSITLPNTVADNKEYAENSGGQYEEPDDPTKAPSTLRSPWPSFREREDEITQVFGMIDKDCNGTLDKSEFIRALKESTDVVHFCEQHKRLQPMLDPLTFGKAFEAIDTDRSNAISEPEFREFLEALNAPTIVEIKTDPGNHNDHRRPSRDSGHYSSEGNGDSKKRRSQMAGNEDATHQDKDGDAAGHQVKKGGFVGDLGHSKLDEEVYDVANFYYKDGIFQAIARSERFINTTLAVICINAVYLGIDSDHNKSELLLEAPIGFIMCEYLFCFFFTFEWVVRFAAFERKLNCLKDAWFKFDSFLVFLMVMETCILPFVMPLISSGGGAPPTGPLRLLRLLRLSRLVRLMRSLPELVVIIKGMVIAFRAVASSLLMILLLIYSFSIIMHMLLKNEAGVAKYFQTLPKCMWTLLLHGTFLLATDVVADKLLNLAKFHTILAVGVLWAFVLLAAITVMNMLIGVLVEVVSAVSASEQEEADIHVMKQTVLKELKRFDNGDGMINEDELNEMMACRDSVKVLQQLGIDVTFLQDLQVWSYSVPGSELPIEALIEQMLSCRTQLNFTVKHMVMQHRLNEWTLRNKLVDQEQKLHRLLDRRFVKLADQLISKQKDLLIRFNPSPRNSLT